MYYNRPQKQQLEKIQPKQELHKHDPMQYLIRVAIAISRAVTKRLLYETLLNGGEWTPDRFNSFISFFIVEGRQVDSADCFTSSSNGEGTKERMCSSLPFRSLLWHSVVSVTVID